MALLWAAYGGLVAIVVAVFTVLFNGLENVRSSTAKALETAHETATQEHKLLWDNVNRVEREHNTARINDAGTRATRGDLAELRDELSETIEKRASLTETRIADVVRYEIVNALNKRNTP